jgi:hypothetical protein
MSNVNRKATKAEMARARRIIREALPGLEPVFGGHGDYGGHRAPRVRNAVVPIAGRARPVSLERGLARSTVALEVSVDDVRTLVRQASGRK